MIKLIRGAIELVFWIAIFSSPLLISCVVAFIIYAYSPGLGWVSFAAIGAGVIAGVIFAEKIRRKYGCTRYMSRLISTPDIYPTDTYDTKKKDKRNF